MRIIIHDPLYRLRIYDPTLTVEAVAGRVGYTSPYAFSKAFKRLTGQAPSEIRRNPPKSGQQSNDIWQ
ncbi:MAG: helix-turn-helix domain-containing protein [Chloroflexota bacterium]|nr:helix-turn-helix domain-containing protein [Chloroflexota bacterium]